MTQEYSLAIYGSQARNDSDCFSDKDFLIAHTEKFNSDYIEQKYSSLGWNCSTYTYEQLEYMSQHGYLFLQHIKQDAHIIKDSGRLSKIIDEYSPMNQYMQEIDDSKKFFSILHFIENTNIGLYWALDVISVGLRNLCILQLANNGEYEFSQAKIYKKIQNLFQLTNCELKMIDLLRQYKYAYRSKQCESYPLNYFINLCNLLANKFHIHINYNLTASNEFITSQLYFIQQSKSLKSYQYQRLCESILNSPLCALNNNNYILWDNMIKNSKDPYKIFSKDVFFNDLFQRFFNDVLC